ncbi:hypothetical protein DGMP_31990 [Desulfomarina profundi]|uniref:DUF106 domain-containing protein n=1 Tax=Desulfomarina profundi TaxID=2772557 RepID=A0A8D5FKZ0_9BACT|nr:hypothetical protein [Desulfomarina profundi]BCL62506.1 hypothetical protein DGMP_31990 [Desulfomarina profundi]
METVFDKTWEYLYSLIRQGVMTLDFLLEHLHFLGPVAVIFLLGLVTVAVTKVLKKYIRTKRLIKLEKEFQYWLSLREEAMRCEDREKAKALAKNIDQAKLNKAYYDYFFEGLMLSFITFYLPVISMASYINESYRSKRLLELFGRDYIFRFGQENPVVIGAVFWFLTTVVLLNIGLYIKNWMKKRYRASQKGQEKKRIELPGKKKGSPLDQSGIERCS